MLPENQVKDIHFFFTSLATIVTGISLWKALKCYKEIRSNREHINLIENQGDQDSLSKSKDYLKGKQIIVSGKVQTIEPPIRIFLKTDSYVLRLKYFQKMYSNESYDLLKGTYQVKLSQIYKTCQIQSHRAFNLAIRNGQKILVKNIDTSNYQKALNIITWEENKKPLSVGQTIQSILLSLIRAIATIVIPDKNFTYLRGIQTGSRAVEVGIKIGAPLAILGVITIEDNGQLIISPIAMFKDRFSYLMDLKDGLANNLQKRDTWLLISAIGGIYLGRRVYKYIQKNGFVLPWNIKK